MHIFSGIHKNRLLQSPKGLKTRPTSGRLREALFNICQGHVNGSHFLDLFAGSGAMGLEAISRGAASATLVDNNKESIRCIHANAQLLKEENHAEVIYGDVFEALKFLANKKRQYDIIYADPPYAAKSERVREKLPDSLRLLKMIDEMIGKDANLITPSGALFLEDSADALKPPEETIYLMLKNSRCMGRSVLHHYILS